MTINQKNKLKDALLVLLFISFVYIVLLAIDSQNKKDAIINCPMPGVEDSICN